MMRTRDSSSAAIEGDGGRGRRCDEDPAQRRGNPARCGGCAVGGTGARERLPGRSAELASIAFTRAGRVTETEAQAEIGDANAGILADAHAVEREGAVCQPGPHRRGQTARGLD